jgi:hypothetical protein
MPSYSSPRAALREVAGRLGLPVPAGRFLATHCPVHADSRASLSLWIGGAGQLRARCFAGCAETAVLTALGCPATFIQSTPTDADIAAEIAEAQHAERNTRRAMALWKAAAPVMPGNLVEFYLRERRGLALPAIPGCLRETGSLWHPWSTSYWPGLIAKVVDPSGGFTGVHRTWLNPATGDKVPLDLPRAMLGPQQHGAIRLFDNRDNNELLIGEGLETSLAAGELDHWKRSVWAACSTAGLMRLHVPKQFAVVVVAADNDLSGAGEHAARVLEHRLRKRGVHARVIKPPKPGTDWNDFLVAKKQHGRAA